MSEAPAKSLLPQRKVAAGGIAGALATLTIGILARNGIELTAEEGAALAAIVGFVVSYMVPNAVTAAPAE